MPGKSLFSRFFVPVSLAEGVSFLVLLLVAMPLKYGADLPVAVSIMGSVHGILFIAYVVLAALGRAQQRWTVKRSIWVLVMAVLPTGAFFAERSVRAELVQAVPAAEPVAV